MCGIAGIVGKGDGAKREAAVRRMTAAIAHRGPDGEGFHFASHGSLGHRRLSIIDPESGRQPLCNEDETVWLTYNGEIYNFQELREQLVSFGHQFRTQCDSEVIVHAYEQWGPDCVKRFRGMFAFALLDRNKRRLMIARDQLGIKPLYYRCDEGQVAFASELPALLEASSQRPGVNPKAVEFFLRYRYIPAPDTGYESVFKLPPATYQLYDFEGNKLQEREYWKLTFAADHSQTEDEWLDEFEDVLMDSIKSHLVADVPFGAFLSGGIDSTLVVSCMAQLLNKQVRAYTIGFDEQQFSELGHARQAADRLGIELRHEIVRPNVVDALQTLFTNYGEPFADTSAVPTWWVSELARRDVPMVLSGDGADEAFAGYHRYGRWLDDSVWSDVKSFAKYPKRLIRRVAETFQQGAGRFRLRRWEQNFVGVLDTQQRRRLWSTDHQELVEAPCDAFERAGKTAAKWDKLSFSQYVDIKTYLPGDILTKVDIASMQHGLEVRTPFTDIRVLEFAARLPLSQRVDETTSERRLKALPKRSLQKQFSNSFVHRNKMGFAIPEAEWMRVGNPVRSCFEDVLASSSQPLFDYFDKSAVEKMKSEFDAKGRHATALWSIFALAFWLDQQSGVVRQRIAA